MLKNFIKAFYFFYVLSAWNILINEMTRGIIFKISTLYLYTLAQLHCMNG